MARQKQLSSSCCISHEFFKSAAQNPNKIAVIHACGGAKITRRFRAGAATDDYDGFYGAVAPTTHPPVFDGDICFTFGEIMSAVDELSARIRCVLCPQSANTGSFPSETPICAAGSEQSPKIIGIYIVPSVEYVIAVLSVLRCGEAFMPINPSWPKERISSILSLSNASLIIRSQYNFDGSRSYEPDKLQQYDDGVQCPELFISIKECIEQKRGSLSLPWPCEIENSRFCYLMYTSGSTGKPKGVCGTEIGLLNRFLWMKESYPYLGEEVLFFKTPISFIDHLQEVLGALLTISTLIIPPFNEIEENPFFVYDFLQAYSINRLITVPSLIRVVLPALQSPYSTRVRNSLRLMVLSGEVFPLPLWETLHEFLPVTTILNLYGSTEVSGDCSYFDCNKLPSMLESEALTFVPIGMPISNCDIVLAGEDSPVQGEVYVGGLGIAIGYYNGLSIMSSDFVKSPHDCSVSEFESQYYFKSGDFARRLKSGDLLFMGRKDRMIKVNGQRIALEEIEGTLRGYQGVVDAVVISRSQQDVVFLEAYIIMRPEVLISKNLKYSLRNWMVVKLPLAMVPNCFFFIKSFPLSSTGKVDYDMFASLKFYTKHEHRESGNIQSTEYLQVIKKVFSDALKVETVSDDDDFFEMGGNSISAAHVSHNLGIDMRLLYIFSSPMSLHMTLFEKEGTSSFGVRPSASKDSLLFSFDTKTATDHALKSNKSSRAFYSQSDGYPTKCRKMNPSFYEKSALNFGDGYPWKSTSMNGACSISRCNKVFCVGVNEGCNLYQSTLSLLIPRDSRGVVRQPWKIYMESCVDASPLVVLKDQDMFLFIGSHSCRFFCIDVKSCCTCWEIKLEGRIECSAAILDNFSQVVVGCYQGKIYFLDFSNGNIYWSFQTGGEVKSQPVVDRSRQLVWCGSYDHNLYGLDYISYCCVYKFQCGGSIFGSPVIDEVQNALYVASTSGRVTAISLKASPCSKLWMCELESPIFGSLAISFQGGTVICCLVDGHVVALNSNGSVFWKVKTGGPIFAGPCLTQTLTSQVLICSRDGNIYSFELKNGSLVWKYDLGEPITSSAYVDENLVLISDPTRISDRLVCVCSSNGSVYLLRVPLETKQAVENGVDEFARVNLQGEIFSSPVMIGGQIFVGCRDDYLHCLTLETSYANTAFETKGVK